VAAARGLIDGFREGDLERLETSLHPSLQRVMVQPLPSGREVLDFLDRAALLEYARLGPDPGEQPAAEVDLLDAHENAAVVRITTEGAIDYVHVAHVNAAWRVVGVLSARRVPEGDESLDEAARTEVERAGLDYVDGFYANDVERIERALHPRLQKVMVQGLPNGREMLRYTSADGLAEYARSGAGGKPEAERHVRVTIHSASMGAASIRVDSADFVDFCHVARINGQWRIVNVVWVPKAPG
jgi:hypothetical protein